LFTNFNFEKTVVNLCFFRGVKYVTTTHHTAEATRTGNTGNISINLNTAQEDSILAKISDFKKQSCCLSVKAIFLIKIFREKFLQTSKLHWYNIIHSRSCQAGKYYLPDTKTKAGPFNKTGNIA
jgi:hypothetical protein